MKIRYCALLSYLTVFCPVGLAQDMPCDACHETEITSPTHSALDCTDCHSNVTETPHQEDPLSQLSSPEMCGLCHDDDVSRFRASIHADLLECSVCHGTAHEVIPLDNLSSPMSPFKQIQTCGECHDEEHLIDDFVRSVHGHALVVSGLVNAPSCSDCHGGHKILPMDDHEATVSRKHVPETCGGCHVLILDTWRKSSHGKAWSAGDESGPVCSTCHSSHEVEAPATGQQRLKFPEDCGGCHSHELATYRDSFHGQATSLGFMTAATCSDCHTPHFNLPITDPESTVNPDNLAATCGRCHDEVSESFLSFNPHLDPTTPETNATVHYIWLFMTTLLFSVFGFFGIHDLLWLQRSAVGFFKGEFDSIRRRGGPYVRRFDPVDMWLHVTIVVSFLLLAITGLPLKFHYTEWSKALSGIFGGVESTRLIHRFAAIVTFGYAIFHLVQLIHKVFHGRDYGLLWGWRSLVPSWRDITDLFQNVRYFLYAGERPKFDRWTYWEKFDYFAVFWGVFIIGMSGLTLWLPSLFTRVFPGWFLNAAHIIHSDEALLATGFIFVFHFFHTHLRPEVFPLDRVIFTGRMSLERFREERPLEYERLLRAGKLDEIIVEDPTPIQIRRAFIFGFSAVGVGLVMVMGMLVAFLLY